jgi:hypothetical protein
MTRAGAGVGRLHELGASAADARSEGGMRSRRQRRTRRSGPFQTILATSITSVRITPRTDCSNLPPIDFSGSPDAHVVHTRSEPQRPLRAKCCRSRRANHPPFFSFVDGHPGLLIVPNCTSAGQRPHVDAHGSKQRRTDRRGIAFCQTLGALRPKQRLVAAKDAAGTARVAPPCWRIGRQPIQSRCRPRYR